MWKSLFGCWLVVLGVFCPLLAADGALPTLVEVAANDGRLTVLSVPDGLEQLQANENLEVLVLQLKPDWQPDWQVAAFDLKKVIVAAKTEGPGVRVGLAATRRQVDALMAHDMAAYIDGYVYREAPYIPDADQTGKLWQRIAVSRTEILASLLDAAALGVTTVILDEIALDPAHRSFLNAIRTTPTGSLDMQPEVGLMPQREAQFFFNPETGNYHLAVYATPGEPRMLTFSIGSGLQVSLAHPDDAEFRQRQYGPRTEIRLTGDTPYYFFLLEPTDKATTMESLEIVAKETIDPYELVVKNQVFKDAEMQKFQSLQATELTNYTYDTPGGPAIDITFEDTLVQRKGQAIERIREKLFIGGVRWKGKDLPELPLIQPEKVQSVPLDIELDKTYTYTYEGEDVIDGHRTWQVRFRPTEPGDFFAGMVWIDQQTGAHRKLRAIQSGLEPPVIGNEISAFYDWVEDGGTRYWTQVREENLQIINIAGARIALQINAQRQDFRFNREDVDQVLATAYASDVTILRDTDDGFRYLKKDKDGQRQVTDDTLPRSRALLGGVLFDPDEDTPIPLAGFNYNSFDFMDSGWQANFFVAGAINDLILSNPDFLGKGWDFTAELFLQAIYFGDDVYVDGEEAEELEVESIRESLNLTLGIPINTFFKFSANYSARYLDYQEADDTREDFVLPTSHVEHLGRATLAFSRARFNSSLEYEFAKRSDWEAFGVPGEMAPVEDSYRTLTFDASISKRLAGFQTLEADVRYLKGWNQDRFSRFGFGFFENRVAGFGSSGIEADEALRLRTEYELGVSGIFSVDIALEGARTWLDIPQVDGTVIAREPIDLAGVGLAVNFFGPWQTLMRVDIGYGVYADLASEEGDFSGQIVFLKLF